MLHARRPRRRTRGAGATQMRRVEAVVAAIVVATAARGRERSQRKSITRRANETKKARKARRTRRTGRNTRSTRAKSRESEKSPIFFSGVFSILTRASSRTFHRFRNTWFFCCACAGHFPRFSSRPNFA
eukprot:164958-Pleurochrysis_carterae.AAC.1